MKKTLLGFGLATLLFVLLISGALAATLMDDFNDGNADGWWFGPSHADPDVYGNWRVENGMLVQDMAGDGFFALLDNYFLSDHIIETQLKLNGPAGYGGILQLF